MRCRRCWRLRHTTNTCRSLPTCSKCTSTEHTKGECTATEKKCINCRGTHESDSETCPHYIHELNICNTQATEGISFAEARSRVKLSPNPIASTAPVTRHHPTHSQQRPINYQAPSQVPNNKYSLRIQQPQQPLPTNISNYTEFPLLPNPQNSLSLTPTHQPQYSIPETQESLISAGQPPSSQSPLYSTRLQTTQQQDISLSQMPLPHLSPFHQTMEYPQQNPPMTAQEHPSQTASNQHELPHTPMPTTTHTNFDPTSFMALLPTLLPSLIQLLFASSLTEKITHVTTIGQLLGLETLVTDTLTSIHLSSRQAES